jgi:hypothetical protein
MFAQGVSISHCMELRQLREWAPDDPALAKGTASTLPVKSSACAGPGGLSHFLIRHELNLADLA